MDNIQRETSKLKRENEELREENRIIRNAAKGQLTGIEWLEREIKEKKCSLAGCRGGKEPK